VPAGRQGSFSLVAQSTTDARRQILDVLAEAAEQLNHALGLLAAAYELLDERAAEQLEDELFGPVQHAYGRLRRTHTEFAARHGLPSREFPSSPEAAPGHGLQGLLDDVVVDAAEADDRLGALQDTMLPVEVGDRELRDGIAETRSRIAPVPGGARRLLRIFGR
jgi:hypothetical protein